MSYDTEEQQLDKLKEWWQENGTSLIVGAVLGLGAFFGWRYWQESGVAEQKAASDLYNKVVEVAESKDEKKIADAVEAVKTQFSDSTYSILSAFQLAKTAVDNKDLDKAAAEFNWVLTNHKDNELANVAKIRLARILIQQDKASDALALLNVDEKSGYYALANLVKGDALLALEKKEDALAAYKIASLEKEITGRHPSLSYKIDMLTSETQTVVEKDSADSSSSSDASTDAAQAGEAK